MSARAAGAGDAGGVGWRVQTPAMAAGAVAVVQLVGADAAALEGAMARLGLPAVRVGGIAVAELLGVDRGVVARWEGRSVHLMPHGGVGVVRALAARLAAAGVDEARELDARVEYPEAASEIEARMLRALSRAASPMAVDVLLDQPRRWAEFERARGLGPDARRGRVLRRLIEPAVVAARGAANIGKSTLLNALAGRGVSIVADEPGTTRDHVGVLLDLGGLVVRWVDTPGMRPAADAAEREAVELARAVWASADVVVECVDAAGGGEGGGVEKWQRGGVAKWRSEEGTGPGAARSSMEEEASRHRGIEGKASRHQGIEASRQEGAEGEAGDGPGVVRVALRADRVGRGTACGVGGWPCEVAVSAHTGEGMDRLVEVIRERLVPRRMVEEERAWRFWE